MSRFQTSLGEEFILERRLPAIGWRPRLRRDADGNLVDLPGIGDADDLGLLAVIGVVVVVLALVLLLLPLLLFVAEVALVLALVIPLMVLALVVGLKQHTVVLRRGGNGEIVDQRQAHGVIGSWRQARQLRNAANAGAYRR